MPNRIPIDLEAEAAERRARHQRYRALIQETNEMLRALAEAKAKRSAPPKPVERPARRPDPIAVPKPPRHLLGGAEVAARLRANAAVRREIAALADLVADAPFPPVFSPWRNLKAR